MFTNWPVVWANAKALFSWFVNVVRTGLRWISTNWKVVWENAVGMFTYVVKIAGMLIAGLIGVWRELHNTQRGGVSILAALGEGFKAFAVVAVKAIGHVISGLARMMGLIGVVQVVLGGLALGAGIRFKNQALMTMGAQMLAAGSATAVTSEIMQRGAKSFVRNVQNAISSINLDEAFAAAHDRLRIALRASRFGWAFWRGAYHFGTEFDQRGLGAFGLDLPGGSLTPFPRIPPMPGWVWPQFEAATGGAQFPPAATGAAQFAAALGSRYPAGATFYVPPPQVEVNVYGPATPEEVGKAVTDKLREEQARLGIRPR